MAKKLKLKRVVIKEELVALTGDSIAAIILNQFLYWSERRWDFDKFIEEEKARNPATAIAPMHGWIYKSTEELCGEIMVSASPSTVRRRIRDLVAAGWLSERHNPNLQWDRTLQYRPDIYRIQCDLRELGYVLAGYPLQFDESDLQDEKTILQNEETILQDDESIVRGDGALPEITAEITAENTTKAPAAPQRASPNDIASEPNTFLPTAEQQWKLLCGSKKSRNWSVPADAQETDGFGEELLRVFCAGIEVPISGLSEAKRENWPRRLRQLAERYGLSQSQASGALVAFFGAGADYDWKRYSTPFARSFEEDAGIYFARQSAGEPLHRRKKHGLEEFDYSLDPKGDRELSRGEIESLRKARDRIHASR